MSPELIAIIIATATLGALILTTTARLGQHIDRDVVGLRERMVRLEGLFEGFTRREPTAPGTGTARAPRPSTLTPPSLRYAMPASTKRPPSPS